MSVHRFMVGETIAERHDILKRTSVMASTKSGETSGHFRHHLVFSPHALSRFQELCRNSC